MENKTLYRIINEEISNFDFLSFDKIKEEDEYDKILSSKEFQTTFISDLINNLNNKNKFKKFSSTFLNSGSDLDEDDNIEIEIELSYFFNEKIYEMVIFLYGNKTFDEYKVDFNDFEINFFSKDGNRIRFDWLENNKKLYTLLIRALTAMSLKK